MWNGRIMVEEYCLDTYLLVRRAWESVEPSGKHIGWFVELGDPPRYEPDLAVYSTFKGMKPCNNRMTKTTLEWHIKNLPYPLKVYRVTAEADNTITVKTTNKKYYKKFKVPDLERVDLSPVQDNISFSHYNNTLIISYVKPEQLLALERKVVRLIRNLDLTNNIITCPMNIHTMTIHSEDACEIS